LARPRNGKPLIVKLVAKASQLNTELQRLLPFERLPATLDASDSRDGLPVLNQGMINNTDQLRTLVT
jgi:hypothetical protein